MTLPKNWEEKELSELIIGKGQYGSGARTIGYNGQNRYVRITDITEGGELNDSVVSPSKIEEEYALEEGDLLFARSGATVGKTYLHKNNQKKYIYAGYLIRFKPNQKLCDPKFLFYFTKTPKYKNWIKNQQTQVAQPNINAKQYSKLKIPVPPLSVQKQIVSILSRAEKLKEKRKEANELTSKLAQSVFAEMFGGEKKNNTDWTIKPFGEICIIQSGGTPSRQVKEYWENGNIPWVGSTVCKDSVVLDAEQYITKKGLDNSAAKWFEINTVLIALVGATIGKTGLLKIKATTNQNIAGIYPKDITKLNPLYLFYASQQLYQKFKTLSNDSFKMATLSFIKNLKIAVPSIEFQNKFATIIEKSESGKEKQIKITNEIDALFDSLMQKAFNGELVS